MRLVAVAVALSAGTLAASACGGAGTSAARSARRKLPESVLVNASKVCGTQLSTGVQTPVVRSFTRAGRYAVGDALFVGHERPLVIRLTAGCSRGARVQLSPAGVVRVLAVARARDGLLAGLALAPLHVGSVRLLVLRAARRSSAVEIRVRR